MEKGCHQVGNSEGAHNSGEESLQVVSGGPKELITHPHSLDGDTGSKRRLDNVTTVNSGPALLQGDTGPNDEGSSRRELDFG